MPSHRAPRRTVWLLLCVGTLAPLADRGGHAAPPEPGAPERTELRPGQIDPETSRVYIFVGKKGLGHEHAIEGRIKSGTVALGEAKSAGEMVFDTSSFAADTDEARKFIGLKGTTSETTREKVTATMLGADVLHVEKFPTATFAIQSSGLLETKGDERTYELSGEFTLHGRARPIKLRARAAQHENRIVLRGEFSILQSDYGITPYRTALGAVAVADELTIKGEIWIGARPAAKK